MITDKTIIPLPEYLEKVGCPKAEFAKKGGWSRQQVHAWCSGKVKPSYKNMLKIFSMTAGLVSLESWGYIDKAEEH